MKEKIYHFLKEMLGSLEEHTPIPFWFLNDTLTKDKLREQLVDFKAKGVDGVVVHPRIGLPKEMPYLSEEYFSMMKSIVETAAGLKMKIVLYDEAMYPSGSAHGEVVKADASYASQGITVAEDPLEGTVIAGPKDGKYIISKPSHGTIRGIHFGEDDGESQAPLSADILNPNSVEKFIELTHEKYFAHLHEYFGTTIIGFFTDEPCVLGRNAGGYFEWTNGMFEALLTVGGKKEELWALFEGEENETVLLYRELVKKRLNDVYYQRLSRWCEKHGILLMGHPAESADIEEETYFHIPGQDLVFRWVSPESGGTKGAHSVMAKCSSDAARHMGRRRNSNECFGVCSRQQIPWYFTGEDMKWYIDWLGIRGVNLFIPHAFYYSLRDQRKEERPPDVGPGNIWWDHYKWFSYYMKRISYLMTDSKNAAKVAVLCSSGEMPVEIVEPFYENQIEFNYLPISLKNEWEEKEGKLHIKGYTYDYIVGPKEMAPSVKHITGIEEIVERDLMTETFCKNLRVSHVVKNGIDLYFLVNEGKSDIQEQVTVPAAGNLLSMDVWNGTFYQLPSQVINGRTRFLLTLLAGESVLFISTKDQMIQAPTKPQIDRIDITQDAKLILEDIKEQKKIYEVSYRTEKVTGREVFFEKAEEMVECYCNGMFAGVSFWNTHSFSCGHLLHKGENTIRLEVTGNIANRYTDRIISYGILPEEMTF